MDKGAKYGGLAIFLLVIIILMGMGWVLTGNSIKKPDSDRDGLNDEDELRIGTDPNNPNTDRDRYLDGEDKEPLKTNSANIKIYLLDKSWNWGPIFANAISLVFKVDSLSSETIIADTEVKLLIKNEGDDYSEYVNYNIIYEVSGHQLMSVSDSLGQLNTGEEKTRIYNKEILLKDAPNLILNSITEWNTGWDIKTDHLDYRWFN